MTGAVGSVRTEVRAGVGIITLDRPDKLNAMTGEMLGELRLAVMAMRDDASVGSVVLTGAGRGFCAGGDLRVQDRAPMAPAPGIDERIQRLGRFSETAVMLHDMPKATIAIINGPCAGAGFALAGACDLRLMGTSAILTSAFVHAGVSGDFGGSYFWTRIAGAARTRALYLLSERVPAADAFSQGLVHRVFGDGELVEQGLAVAARLASAPRHVVAQMKRNIAAAEDGNMASAMNCELQGMILTLYQTFASGH